MGIVIQKLRDSAEGQDCTFKLPGICNGDRQTTVLCHCRIGYLGGASKPDDFSSAAFGCHACHTAIDNHMLPAHVEAATWLRAIQQTQRIWYEAGLMKFPEAPERRVKTLSKIVPHDGRMRR
jgi:hypothetical protein